MIGGKYDRLITINRSTDSASTASGSVTKTWSSVATDVPARYDVVGGGTVFEADQRVANQNVVFGIRYPFSFSVLENDQVVFEGKTGKIESVDENTKAPRRSELLITVNFKDN